MIQVVFLFTFSKASVRFVVACFLRGGVAVSVVAQSMAKVAIGTAFSNKEPI